MDGIKVTENVRSLAISGGLEKPRLLKAEEYGKPPKWARRRADTSARFHYSHGICRYGNSLKVDGLAYWEDGYDVAMMDRLYRMRVLVVHLGENRYTYIIPDQMLSQLKALPNVDLSVDTLKLLLSVADDISDEVQFEPLEIENPVAAEIVRQQKPWLESEFDQEKFFPVFSETGLNLELMAAVADAHFHMLAGLEGIPRGITNLILSDETKAGKDYIVSLMRALTFANHNSIFNPGPIELRGNDTAGFSAYMGRVSLIDALEPGSKLLAALLNDTETEDHYTMSGGISSYYPAELPMVVSKSPKENPYVANIVVPTGLPKLTPEALDMFRAAAARVIQLELLNWCVEKWRQMRERPDAYRVNGLELWRNLIRTRISEVLFGETDQREVALKFADERVGNVERVQEQKIQAIMDGYREFKDMKALCVDKESVKADDEAAFYFTFSKSSHKGESYIGFTSEDIIVDKLQKIGLTHELLIPFLLKMKENGICIANGGNQYKYKVSFRSGDKKNCILLRVPEECSSLVP